MNLQQYQDLTGKTVAEADKVFTTNQIKRSVARLEQLLGYTLSPSKTNTNIYNEMGKATTLWGWSYPDVDISTLSPPDEIIGSYRLFRFNADDQYLTVDPFIALHAVKLVWVTTGYPDDNIGVTFRTFDKDEVRPQYGREGIGKYIERVHQWKFIFRDIPANQHLQLAVDADWMFQDCLPDELKYVLIDMIESKLDAKHNIQMESIDGHTYRKFDKEDAELDPTNASIIKYYAGPNGSVHRIQTL